jgi:hypothetical protein
VHFEEIAHECSDEGTSGTTSDSGVLEPPPLFSHLGRDCW